MAASWASVATSDLCRYLVGHPIVDWSRSTLKAPTKDTASLCLEFSDGSIASINYFLMALSLYPRKDWKFRKVVRLYLTTIGVCVVLTGLDLRKRICGARIKGRTPVLTRSVQAIEGGLDSPIPLEEILEVSEVSIALGEQ